MPQDGQTALNDRDPRSVITYLHAIEFDDERIAQALGVEAGVVSGLADGTSPDADVTVALDDLGSTIRGLIDAGFDDNRIHEWLLDHSDSYVNHAKRAGHEDDPQCALSRLDLIRVDPWSVHADVASALIYGS